MITLLIATRNSHKVEEIRAILGKKFQYLTLKDFFGAPPIVEDGLTFTDNARKKSIGIAQWLAANPRFLPVKVTDVATQFYVLADDSGLAVDALGGAPGVHSARFVAVDMGVPGNSPDSANNGKLMRLMQKVPADQRAARFHCVIALTQVVFPKSSEKALITTPEGLEKYTHVFEGVCEGKISHEASGKSGFGYDPLFIPNGYDASFADLDPKIKNKLSHRSQALAKVKQHLKS